MEKLYVIFESNGLFAAGKYNEKKVLIAIRATSLKQALKKMQDVKEQ